MSKTIWLRVKLPEKDLRQLRSDFSSCELMTEPDDANGPEQLQRIEGVFTQEVLPESVVQRTATIKMVFHVTRGGVNAYLTPSVKARPIQVTGLARESTARCFRNLPSRAF